MICNAFLLIDNMLEIALAVEVELPLCPWDYSDKMDDELVSSRKAASNHRNILQLQFCQVAAWDEKVLLFQKTFLNILR